MSYRPSFPCILLLAGLFAGYSAAPAYAENSGMKLLKHRCASCHNLTGPAPRTLAGLRSRKGPDMFYAGDKYRREWLQSWLRHPVRIRPAGMFYATRVKTGVQADVVNLPKLQAHMALNASDASLAADALMQLRSNTLRVNALLHQRKGMILEVLPRGRMLFNHVYGCISCHQTAPGHGGLSGPELYSAGKRMTEAFIRSYIRSPQLWDPKVGMPNIHASGENIEKLTAYIESLSGRGRNL